MIPENGVYHHNNIIQLGITTLNHLLIMSKLSQHIAANNKPCKLRYSCKDERIKCNCIRGAQK